MRNKAVRIAVCEYQTEAGISGGIVSLGKISGTRPCLVSPGRPERGKLMIGGRAEWIPDLAAWSPFEDKSVTHGLVLSNALYSGGFAIEVDS